MGLLDLMPQQPQPGGILAGLLNAAPQTPAPYNQSYQQPNASAYAALLGAHAARANRANLPAVMQSLARNQGGYDQNEINFLASLPPVGYAPASPSPFSSDQLNAIQLRAMQMAPEMDPTKYRWDIAPGYAPPSWQQK